MFMLRRRRRPIGELCSMLQGFFFGGGGWTRLTCLEIYLIPNILLVGDTFDKDTTLAASSLHKQAAEEDSREDGFFMSNGAD